MYPSILVVTHFFGEIQGEDFSDILPTITFFESVRDRKKY